MTALQPTVHQLNRKQFALDEKKEISSKIVSDELRNCFDSQPNKQLDLPHSSEKISPISEQFINDLTRGTYVINGKLISQPGTDCSIALNNVLNALTSKGELDRQGLYAISKFANQSVLAGPSILMGQQMNDYFPPLFCTSTVSTDLRYDIAVDHKNGLKITVSHIKHIDKIADEVDRGTWIHLSQDSYLSCHTDVYLDRATIDNIDAVIKDKDSAALNNSHSGYTVRTGTPTCYVDALNAMGKETRWSLFSSYIKQAMQAKLQPDACFKSPATARVNNQLKVNIESPGVAGNTTFTDDRFLAKDIFVLLLTRVIGGSLVDLERIAPGLEKKEQSLTVELVNKVAEYVLATYHPTSTAKLHHSSNAASRRSPVSVQMANQAIHLLAGP